jgi:hypothetical protein
MHEHQASEPRSRRDVAAPRTRYLQNAADLDEAVPLFVLYLLGLE